MSFSTRIITTLLLLQLAVFAAQCEAGFKDNISVRVFSEEFVLIENAEVNLTYQLDETTAKGYFTASKLTNNVGMADFIIQNIEVLQSEVDCDVEITVRFDNQLKEETITATFHSRPVDFYIEAYPITIHVVDENDKPVENAEVFVQNRSGVTDKFGRATFVVGKGTVYLFAKYDIGKVENIIEVEGPTDHTVSFAFYPLNIKTIDDQGNPLNAVITVGENEYDAKTGELELLKIAKAKPFVNVRHNSLERLLDVDLSVQSDYVAVFDFTPPKLVEVKRSDTVTPNRLKLGVEIIDEGRYASGLQPDGVLMNYRFDAGEWDTARAYSVALNQYGVDLVLPLDARVLFFTIETVDQDGNKASFDGQMNLEAEPTPTENNTTTEPVPEPEPEGEFPFAIVAGVVVIIVLAYLVYRFKVQGGDE
jgi:hypothetical protein